MSPPKQTTLNFEPSNFEHRPTGPVECLGLTFPSDEERRNYFLKRLREGLEELHAKLGGVPFTTVEDAVARLKSLEKWPVGDDQRIRELAERIALAARQSSKFKVQGLKSGNEQTLNLELGTWNLLRLYKDEVGFPHGEIEDILNLSDPPYYTACPNPFIEDFIKHWREREPRMNTDRHRSEEMHPSESVSIRGSYHREPFAADVSEGKNDPIYNAHSYHTKVPHKAIMRYILHYTEPGDVVFDGFCGTGMTGVAAQLCGDRKTVESLGYKVDDKGIIYQQETDENGKTVWRPFSKLGARYAVLNDLSPAATFIASALNGSVTNKEFGHEFNKVVSEVENTYKWMYETQHSDGSITGSVAFTVWSDVLTCPNCQGDFVFWTCAFDSFLNKIKESFPCPKCGAIISKKSCSKAIAIYYDELLETTYSRIKHQPVLIQCR